MYAHAWISFSVHPCPQESRKLVEETLLGVKGVISFTFNMAQRRCIVRTRTDLKTEVPCRALEATKALAVKHVVKNENGEEVRHLFD